MYISNKEIKNYFLARYLFLLFFNQKESFEVLNTRLAKMALSFQRSHDLWTEQARFEAQICHELRYQHGKGPFNIFILDTSSFLGEEGSIQLKETFTTIIDEYSNHPDIDENVAVIVCGRHTKFLRHYSNQYQNIKRCLDDVEFGGPCPLSAAFLLLRGVLGNFKHYSRSIGDFHVHQRIILISNGRPTDYIDIDSDSPPLTGSSEGMTHLIKVTGGIGRVNPIFCVPVGGNPALSTLEFLSGQSRGGKVVYPDKARQLAKCSQNLKTAAMLSFTIKYDGEDRERILTSLVCTCPHRVFSELDQNDIIDLCMRKPLFCSMDVIIKEIEDDQELYIERDLRMPPLGSRVKRGRDWQWGDQDMFGPGTVVGHSKDVGWLRIAWDKNKAIYPYRYGSNPYENDKYDVMICDEPRILEGELIAPGCLVTRGPDWEWGNQDGGAKSIGTVLRVDDNGVVLVYWKHGSCHQYRYGYDDKIDLQLCDPFSPESVRFLKTSMLSVEEKYPGGTNVSSEEEFENTHCLSNDKNEEAAAPTSVDSTVRPTSILQVTKGKYFKNSIKETIRTPDIETDGPNFSTVNQWWWRDSEGIWNPHSKEANSKINKCYKRDPKSTVVVMIKDQTYRVVMAKNIQINLTTRDYSDVKLAKEGDFP
ncbi:uncharacterized protein LOC128176193 [Crassostrea angulata]|uniref:uncharacterized protein LOC128176193 n=1 Tax=Magallana angulata TaxID=2784310 RepID=UPI0022B083F5|nr:uncharacterized protein LOC128176193 [Crassostrea angulata]